jgi:hypothetical protein
LIATGAVKAVWSPVGKSARRSAINSIAFSDGRAARAKDGCNLAGSFSLHSPINGNLGQQVLVFQFENKSWFLNASKTRKLEVKVMKKMLTALVAAATIAGAAVATSAPAEARWGGGWHGGWRGGGWGWGLGGFAAGAVVGSALAAPYYYGGYGPYGYYGAPYPYGPPCVWRRVWTGYVWNRACI